MKIKTRLDRSRLKRKRHATTVLSRRRRSKHGFCLCRVDTHDRTGTGRHGIVECYESDDSQTSRQAAGKNTMLQEILNNFESASRQKIIFIDFLSQANGDGSVTYHINNVLGCAGDGGSSVCASLDVELPCGFSSRFTREDFNMTLPALFQDNCDGMHLLTNDKASFLYSCRLIESYQPLNRLHVNSLVFKIDHLGQTLIMKQLDRDKIIKIIGKDMSEGSKNDDGSAPEEGRDLHIPGGSPKKAAGDANDCVSAEQGEDEILEEPNDVGEDGEASNLADKRGDATERDIFINKNIEKMLLDLSHNHPNRRCRAASRGGKSCRNSQSTTDDEDSTGSNEEARNAAGSETRSVLGSEIINMLGSEVRSVSGSEVRNTLGSEVRNTPGSKARSVPGSEIINMLGSEVRNTPGSEIMNMLGSEVRSTPVSETRNTSGSEVRVCLETEIGTEGPQSSVLGESELQNIMQTCRERDSADRRSKPSTSQKKYNEGDVHSYVSKLNIGEARDSPERGENIIIDKNPEDLSPSDEKKPGFDRTGNPLKIGFMGKLNAVPHELLSSDDSGIRDATLPLFACENMTSDKTIYAGNKTDYVLSEESSISLLTDSLCRSPNSAPSILSHLQEITNPTSEEETNSSLSFDMAPGSGVGARDKRKTSNPIVLELCDPEDVNICTIQILVQPGPKGLKIEKEVTSRDKSRCSVRAQDSEAGSLHDSETSVPCDESRDPDAEDSSPGSGSADGRTCSEHDSMTITFVEKDEVENEVPCDSADSVVEHSADVDYGDLPSVEETIKIFEELARKEDN